MVNTCDRCGFVEGNNYTSYLDCYFLEGEERFFLCSKCSEALTEWVDKGIKDDREDNKTSQLR